MTSTEANVPTHCVCLCVCLRQLVSTFRASHLVWEGRCSIPLRGPWADGKVSGADVDSQSSQSAVLAGCNAQQHYKLRQKFGPSVTLTFPSYFSWTGLERSTNADMLPRYRPQLGCDVIYTQCDSQDYSYIFTWCKIIYWKVLNDWCVTLFVCGSFTNAHLRKIWNLGVVADSSASLFKIPFYHLKISRFLSSDCLCQGPNKEWFHNLISTPPKR